MQAAGLRSQGEKDILDKTLINNIILQTTEVKSESIVGIDSHKDKVGAVLH